MNNKPEIAEPQSDGLVLMSCLDLNDGLRHEHAQAVLSKYKNPDDLAIQIIRTSKEAKVYAEQLRKIRQLLYDRVFTSGSDEENLSLFVELFDEEEADYTN